MTTPDAADSPQIAPGWYANDLHPDDISHLLERFICKFQPGDPDQCWLWTGSRAPNGYGWLARSRQSALLAHRVSWVAFTGRALTDNLTIDHLCNTKLCVNPAHLEPVTLFENVRRKSERLGYTIGGKKRTGPRPCGTRPPYEGAYAERMRENALRYYYEHREEILAKRRAEPRTSAREACAHCGIELRHDGMRRHIRRMHGEAKV
jgi:hypothetical protein